MDSSDLIAGFLTASAPLANGAAPVAVAQVQPWTRAETLLAVIVVLLIVDILIDAMK